MGKGQLPVDKELASRPRAQTMRTERSRTSLVPNKETDPLAWQKFVQQYNVMTESRRGSMIDLCTSIAHAPKSRSVSMVSNNQEGDGYVIRISDTVVGRNPDNGYDVRTGSLRGWSRREL